MRKTADDERSAHAHRKLTMADAHVRALYRIALHFTHHRADAEDLVQDTFFRAWRSFDNFQPGTNARAWLATILRHAHIDRHRRDHHWELEDTGVRFDPAAAFAMPHSSGVTGMCERTRLLDGDLTVDSAPGSGTWVTAERSIEYSDMPTA